MFARLADLVIRRYKIIIVVWLIVLFYVFPLIFKIGEVVVYQESEVGLEKLEAVMADALIQQNFPGRVAPSTLLIVVQNSDVLSDDVRGFSVNLHDALASSGLQGVRRIDYLYGTIETYIGQFAYQTASVLHVLAAQTNQTALMLFGMPLDIVERHMSLLPLVGDDSATMQMVLEGIEAELIASGADDATIALTLGYAAAFYEIWLPTHETDPGTIASQIRVAAGNFFVPMLPDEAAEFALAVSEHFSMSDFASASEQVSFALGLVSTQASADVAFLAAVWTLGPAPSYEQAHALARDVVRDTHFNALPLPLPIALLSQFVNLEGATGQANTTMLIVITMDVSGSSETAKQDVRIIRSVVKEHIAQAGPGYEAYVTGDAAFEIDIMDAVDRDTSRIEPTTVLLVVLLVGLFFRSAVTPWVPLMTVGMAYLTSIALIYVLGTLVLEIHYSVLTVVLTVMMGAGTDYCIFILSRYREERVFGRSKEDAIRTSLTWAGESIATSGATVMIGFGALMIGDYTLVRSMGMALVLAVGMALAFALTMLPSLVMLVGDRVFWPSTVAKARIREHAREKRGGGYFRKSAQFSLKHAKAIVVAAALISLPAVYLVFSLESSYDFIAGLPDVESKAGMNALGEGFGKGTIMPTYVVVRFSDEVVVGGSLRADAAAELERYCQLLASHENVRAVSGPTRPFGDVVNDSFLANLSADERATYQVATFQTLGADNRTVMLTVVLEDEPFALTSVRTIDELRRIDDVSGDGIFDAGTEVFIGGATASMTDVSRTVSADFFTMRFVVIIGIYVVLLVVLGSLLIPLRLILTVLLSVIWTIAMTMIIFQYINGVPVLWMMPLILFVIAMGLGMDYDIFLTTRIREEVAKGKTDEQAILTAVERTGGIITACGAIMAGAFGSMMLSSTALLQEFGFGLSFAIILDAMIVRIYVVPAIMLLLKKWNWYAPGRLQRVRREEKARKH